MKTFKMGDRVKIYNHKLSGERFMEGIAVVGRKVDGENYRVCFEDDHYRCERNLSEAERA